jgi:flagellar assembly protein FliH
VGAEEKKLSPSSEVDAAGEGKTGFRLHYFPDIPLDDPDDTRTCIPLKDIFRRTRFNSQNNAREAFSRDCGFRDANQEETEKSDGRFDVDAYQKGFKDGLEKGADEGQKAGLECASRKMEPLLSSLRDALMQLKDLRSATYLQTEKEIVELSLAIARKVIWREIKTDRKVVLDVVREALSRLENPGKINIKMNPADLQFIKETGYNLSDLIGNIENVSLEAEENIQSGGCIIETNSGEIDARIENQIQAVEESFRRSIENLDPPD